MKLTTRQPHGLALMLVISLLAAGTLVGLAMLSAATLQSQVAHSAETSVAADYLAESGAQTAAYYLQRDLARMPASWSTTPGYAIYATNVTVSGISGSFDVSAVATGITDEYRISATGRSSGSSTVTRTASSRIRVQRQAPSYASGFSNPLAVTILGHNIFNGGAVVSNGVASVLGTINGGTRTYSSDDFSIPTAASGQINYYGGNVASGTYVMPNGNVGTPQILASGTIASSAAVAALATNPGKVFYYNGNIAITGSGTYNATLIARGNIDLRPPLGSSVTINRQSGFPALIADGQLQVNQKSLNVNINGVVWAGTGTSWHITNSLNSNVRINGALLTPALTLSAAVGTLTVTYTPTNTDVINLTPNILQQPVGLKLVEWNQ